MHGSASVCACACACAPDSDKDQRGHLEKCVDAHLGTAITSDKDINEDTRIWPAGAGCTINNIHVLNKLFLKSQPLAADGEPYSTASRRSGRKCPSLSVIAILEMCTDPELSKRFREVKTNEFTWDKLKEVVEVYERATASDNRAMLVNSNKKNWKKNQSKQGTSTKQCFRCNRKSHSARECRTYKEKLYYKFCKAKGHVSEACKKEVEEQRQPKIWQHA